MCDCDNGHAARCNLKTLHVVITGPFLLEKIYILSCLNKENDAYEVIIILSPRFLTFNFL
jgi:hypothetical protein